MQSLKKFNNFTLVKDNEMHLALPCTYSQIIHVNFHAKIPSNYSKHCLENGKKNKGSFLPHTVVSHAIPQTLPHTTRPISSLTNADLPTQMTKN